MSKTKKLLTQSSGYFAGQFLALMASFISFPILTRILSVSDYGILSYISSIMVLLVAISKMGMQHSAVRFYPEFRSKRIAQPIANFYSTVYLGPVAFGTILASIFIAGIVTNNDLFDKNLSGFFVIVAISIPFQCGLSTFVQFLRAEQKIRFFNLMTVMSRYVTLFLSVGLILFVTNDLWGYYYGFVLSQTFLFLYITFYLYIAKGFSVKYFSLNFLKIALAYGAPLFGYEFCAQILEYGDRLLLKYFIGIEAVAIYSVGYNPAMYISNLFGTPLRLAIVPIYLEIWTAQGKPATKEFLSKALSYFFVIAIPIIFGVCAVKKEMITLLASKKYALSYEIIPYVIIGTMLYSANSILSAGLFIYKKTYFLTLTLILGTSMNLVLNIILIPKMGLSGAAIATLVTYLFILFLNFYLSSKFLELSVDFRILFITLFSSAIMFLLIERIYFGNLAYDLICKIIAGIVSYGSLLLLFEKRIRFKIVTTYRKARCRAISTESGEQLP